MLDIMLTGGCGCWRNWQQSPVCGYRAQIKRQMKIRSHSVTNRFQSLHFPQSFKIEVRQVAFPNVYILGVLNARVMCTLGGNIARLVRFKENVVV